MKPLVPTPRPWRFELGIVYGGDGTIVADNVGIKDGPLVAAAPSLLAALSGTVCHGCSYRVGWEREGPSCSACSDARAAVAAARHAVGKEDAS